MKNAIKLLGVLMITIFIFGCSEDDDTTTPVLTVTDADGNIYNTIQIGNQIWMLENLKTTKFNDGTPINEWLFGMDWGSLSGQQPLFQWASTADLNNIYPEVLPSDYYGAMYNHFAIQNGNLAPVGWKIPSEQDFIDLENYLNNNGHSGNVATALKSTIGWTSFSGSGTNAIGFNGLPNGYIAAGGTATGSETICSWGTSDIGTGPINSSLNRKWVQLFDQSNIVYSDTSIVLGVAIRCIKE